jgi:hypothetical protein
MPSALLPPVAVRFLSTVQPKQSAAIVATAINSPLKALAILRSSRPALRPFAPSVDTATRLAWGQLPGDGMANFRKVKRGATMPGDSCRRVSELKTVLALEPKDLAAKLLIISALVSAPARPAGGSLLGVRVHRPGRLSSYPDPRAAYRAAARRSAFPCQWFSAVQAFS